MKKWFQSKKFWCGLLAAGIMVGHQRLDISFDAAQTAAYALVSGAGIEGLVDIVALLKGQFRNG